MSERLSELNSEQELHARLLEVAVEYFDRGEVEFLDDLEDIDSKACYINARLIGMGKDPDEVIYGDRVFEGGSDEF